MQPQEQVERAQSFLQEACIQELHKQQNKGEYAIILDFQKLAQHDPELADALLEEPEDIIRAFELAIENLIENKKFKARFINLPPSQSIAIRNIRSTHINKLMFLQGIVRQSSDVRPQVTSAKFECPSCGNTISILQLEQRFKEPSRCTCGRRGKFRLLSKDLVDAQRLVLEESPELLEGGEQPKRLSVFLQEDLVEPKMEKKSTPGSKILVTGVVKEVPIILRTGAASTRYDLMMEANSIIPIEETFEELEINEEDEEKIKDLSKDARVFERLVNSIAPSIYGHEKVKEALVLQLMGGVQKKRDDGTKTRGDMHILLVGDPGCIAGDSRVALISKGMKPIKDLGRYHGQKIRERVVKIRKNQKGKYYDFTENFQHYSQQPVLKVITETGKQVICTFNQPFLTKQGWKRADEIALGTKIRVMPKIPMMIKKYAPTGFISVEAKSGPLKKVAIPEMFTPELAALSGYLLGDGNLHPAGYRVTAYVNDEEKDLIEKLAPLWQGTFQVQPEVFTRVNRELRTIDNGNGLLRQIISTQPMHIIEVNSRQVASCLSFLSKKRVPQQIFQSPLPVMASFISWLFEADGCAFESKERGRAAIQLKSATPRLLQDVQLLLLYFGIHSRINKSNLCIRRAGDMKSFITHIGFQSQKKIKKSHEVLTRAEELSRIHPRKRNQRWEKVVEILPAGIMDVYDFEVPRSKQFIANGIVCHNSGKSQLLTFISKIAPKARYISGKGASLDYKEPLLLKKEDGTMSMTPIGSFVDAHCNGVSEGVVPITKEIYSLCLNLETYKLEWKQISAVFRHKIQEKLLRFTLESGRRVTVTKDHSIFVIENGRATTKEASTLTKEDYVLVPSRIPTDASNQTLNKDLARFIGYYIAEGYVRSKDGSYRICLALHKDEKEIIEDIREIADTNFKKEIKIQKKGTNGIEVIIYGKESYLKLLELLGDVAHKKAKEKRIPLSILNAPIEIQHEFIKAYIKGDYGVTKSEALMSDILYLFLQEGRIAGASVREEIGISKIKDRVINHLGERFDLKSPHPNKTFSERYKRIPIHKLPDITRETFFKSLETSEYKRAHIEKISNKKLLDRVMSFKEGYSVKGNDLRSAFGESALEYFGDNSEFFYKAKEGRSCLVHLTEKGQNLVENLIELRRLINADIGFVKIKKIEEIESSSEFVYDVSVPGYENFVAGFGGIICHNTSAGLTASVVKDEFLRGWALEAGAMVLANGGLCAIDELDKMSVEDTSALHEALEQQRISISKANIQATLRTETTVLAAANPKLGRFDPYAPIASQIDMPPALINRFDLIFPIRDIPSRELDTKIASHVLKLQQKPSELASEIPAGLFRKYIAYARSRIKPVLSDQAIEEIQKFYVELRNKGQQGEEGIKPIPISARQLEALVRLAEGSARVRLSKKVTAADAKRSIELLKHCLMQVGFDYETGEIDIDRITTGISSSQRSRIITIREIIRELEAKLGRNIPIEEIIAAAQDKKIDEAQVEESIERLKREGEIFEPRPGQIARL